MRVKLIFALLSLILLSVFTMNCGAFDCEDNCYNDKCAKLENYVDRNKCARECIDYCRETYQDDGWSDDSYDDDGWGDDTYEDDGWGDDTSEEDGW